MSHSKISAALSGALYSFSVKDAPDTIIPVEWENAGSEFDSSQNASVYLSEHYMPAGTTGVGVSFDDSLDYSGVYQIDVWALIGKRKFAANTMADALMSWFKLGSVFSYGGQEVIVESVTRGQGMRDNTRWYVPVTVNWRAFSGNA